MGLFNKSKAIEQKEPETTSTQELIKVRGIKKGFYVTQDWRVVAVLKCGTVNRELLSRGEKKLLDEEYTSLLKTFYFKYQELFVSEPKDMNEVIEKEKTSLRQLKDFNQRKLKNSYIKFLSDLGSSGQALDRTRYFIFDEKIERMTIKGFEDACEVLRERGEDVLNSFSGAKLKVEFITDLEAGKLLQILYDYESAQQFPIDSVEVPKIIRGGMEDGFIQEETAATAE